MKKLIALLLCGALTLGLLCGCAQEELPYVPTGNGLSDGNFGGTVVKPSEEDPQALSLLWDPDGGMNPYSSMNDTNRVLFSLIYQGLFTVDRSYRVSPMLCESYNVSADMKAYTFYIGEARFSDGTAVTAACTSGSFCASGFDFTRTFLSTCG